MAMLSPPWAARTRSCSPAVAACSVSIWFTSARLVIWPGSDDATSPKERVHGGGDLLWAFLGQQVPGPGDDLDAQVVSVGPGAAQRPGRDEEVALAVEHQRGCPQPAGPVRPEQRWDHLVVGELVHQPFTGPCPGRLTHRGHELPGHRITERCPVSG